MRQRIEPSDRPVRKASAGFAAVLIGVLVIVLDTTVVNVAAPNIAADLGGAAGVAQWTVNGYNLTFAALLLSAGAVADRLGGRRVFGAGLAVFVAASLACGVAPTPSVLVAARLVQGVGAALMLPTGLSLASAIFAAPAARARAFGLWAAVAGTATVLGPPLGGILTDTLGWRAIFLLNVPAGTAALVMLRRTPETPIRRRRFDPAGQLLGMLALGGVAVALTEAGRRGWASAFVVCVATLAAGAAVALAVVERWVRTPMIPGDLVHDRRFAGASVTGAILSVGIYGQMFVLSLSFQHGRGYSASGTGLAMLPFALTSAAGAAVAGRAVAGRGPRAVLLTGQAAGAAGSLILATAPSDAPYWALAIALFLLGICQAACQPAVATAAMAAAPAGYVGIASGVLTAARQTGSVLGVAFLGALAGDASDSAARASAAVAVLFVLGGAVTAVALRLPGGRPSSRHLGDRPYSQPPNKESRMRAIVIDTLGDPEVLKVANIAPPRLKPGHVLVSVAAAGINYTDTRQRRGIGPAIALPFTPGVEGAGTIVAVGDGVTDLRTGDRIAWQGVPGSYAEQVLVPAVAAVPLPDDLTDEQAAAVLLQGLTAHQLAGLTVHLPDQARTAVLHAAAGGVGRLLTQILQIRGHRVIATVSTDAKAAAARSAGAAEVLLSGDPRLAERILDLTDGIGAGIVYDGVGASLFTQSLAALAVGGVLAHFGQAAGPAPDINPFQLPRSILLTKPVVTDHVATRPQLLAHADELFGWLRTGRLDLQIQRFDLAEAEQAHRRIHDRQNIGKLLLINL